MKRVLVSLLVALSIAFIAAPAHAQDNLSSGEGSNILSGGSLVPKCIGTPEGSRSSDASCVTESIVFYTNLLLWVVAIGAFIYMLYGAFLYATAFGEESKVAQAKKTISHALIGVIIASLSVLMVELVKSLLNYQA